MKHKTVHAARLRLRRDHPDVIAAIAMGLVTCDMPDPRVDMVTYTIGDRDVTEIVRELVKYRVIE